MFICYTHSFGNKKGESHRLLADAVAEFMCRRPDHDETVCLGSSDHAAGKQYADRAESLAAEMMTGEQGKPYIPGFAPFSISHSNNTWAVLIAESECGLDIQYPRRANFDSIAGRFYSPSDAARVQEVPDDFFRIWTRREALIKAAGTSVADTDLPPVLGDRVMYRGTDYRIYDIVIPDAPELYAAICLAETPEST